MSRLLKFIIFSIAGLVVALAVAVYVLLAVIDPNRYRSAIQTVVLTQTGLQAVSYTHLTLPTTPYV